MLKLTVKTGNKTLHGNDTFKFRHGDSVSVNQLYSDLNKVYSVFLSGHDCNFQVKAGWSQARHYSTVGGTYYSFEDKIEMNVQKYDDYASFLQNCYHELGHMHHCKDNRSDFYSRTPYGKELYAEDFANMCLGDDYQLSHATNFRVYDGYNTRQVYSQPRKQLIREKIKPLTK